MARDQFHLSTEDQSRSISFRSHLHLLFRAPKSPKHDSTTRQLQGQQHECQAKYNKPVPRNFIGFCNWLALECKGRLQTGLDDNRSNVLVEPVPVEVVPSAEVNTETVSVENEEDADIDWDQLRAILASTD